MLICHGFSTCIEQQRIEQAYDTYDSASTSRNAAPKVVYQNEKHGREGQTAFNPKAKNVRRK